ncbi:MAG: hypothetical protein V4644_03225 [Patescibacteria group bacterium]
MDEITIGDKVYVSSKQAAKITGYAKDYVGQLCREGRVEARLVGRNWYVLEDSIREHRFGKPEIVETAPEAPEEPVDRSSSWQKPQYEAETVSYVPELAPKPQENVQSAAIVDMQSAWKEWFEEKAPMQKALPDGSQDFREEYLPMLQPEPAQPAYTPAYAPISAVSVPESEEREMIVPITRVAETTPEEPVRVPAREEEESDVELHRSYDSRSTGEQVPVTAIPIVDLSGAAKIERRGKVSKKARQAPHADASSWTGTIRALLIVVAVAVALIALVGTGNADALFAGTSLDFGAQKEIVDFLAGKSTYEGSLR